MKRATLARALVFGALVIGAALVAACVTVIGPDDVQYGVGADGGGADQASSDAVTTSDGSDADAALPPCDAAGSPFNLEGCACAAGDQRYCYLGNPAAGDASACKQNGTQICGGGVWLECKGASGPDPRPDAGADADAAADTCFDGIDNDCDGIVDDGCLCSAQSDLCHAADGGALNANGYNWFTVPAQPKAGKPFDVYVVTQALSVNPQVSFARTSPGYCGGGAVQRPCPTAGANCSGWKVLRFPWTEGAQGSYTYELFVNDNNGPCNQANKVSVSQPILVGP